MTLLDRLQRACQAFLANPQYRNTFAVIYDVRQKSGDDSEEYYEAFCSPEEANKMFGDAFGNDDTVHNARLVLVLDTIKPQKD